MCRCRYASTIGQTEDSPQLHEQGSYTRHARVTHEAYRRYYTNGKLDIRARWRGLELALLVFLSSQVQLYPAFSICIACFAGFPFCARVQQFPGYW